MLIYAFRHGETDYNTAGLIQGQLDIPLNEKGRLLARTVGEALREVSFDAVFTSPLCRAKETAALLVAPGEKRRGTAVPVFEDSRLLELNFGDWSGHRFKKDGFSLPGVTVEEYNLFYTDPFHMKRPPHGETVQQLCERAGAFFTELVQNPFLTHKTVLVSTHGCALRALLRAAYGHPEDFWHGGFAPNCSYTLLRAEHGSIAILEEDAVLYDPSLCVNLFVPEK